MKIKPIEPDEEGIAFYDRCNQDIHSLIEVWLEGNTQETNDMRAPAIAAALLRACSMGAIMNGIDEEHFVLMAKNTFKKLREDTAAVLPDLEKALVETGGSFPEHFDPSKITE